MMRNIFNDAMTLEQSSALMTGQRYVLRWSWTLPEGHGFTYSDYHEIWYHPWTLVELVTHIWGSDKALDILRTIMHKKIDGWLEHEKKKEHARHMREVELSMDKLINREFHYAIFDEFTQP